MKLLRIVFTALLGVFLLAPSAQALSCVQPDIMRDFERAKASEKSFHIFVGHITSPKLSTQPKFERSGENRLRRLPIKPSERMVTGYFTGYSLTGDAQSDVHLTDYPVTVRVSCAAHWCGSAPNSEQKIIAFLEASEDAPPVLTRGPCPSMSHAYDPAAEAAMRSGL